MTKAETIHRTFATRNIPSKGLILFLHDITKDAESTVEQMRQANDDYEASINQADAPSSSGNQE